MLKKHCNYVVLKALLILPLLCAFDLLGENIVPSGQRVFLGFSLSKEQITTAVEGLCKSFRREFVSYKLSPITEEEKISKSFTASVLVEDSGNFKFVDQKFLLAEQDQQDTSERPPLFSLVASGVASVFATGSTIWLAVNEQIAASVASGVAASISYFWLTKLVTATCSKNNTDLLISSRSRDRVPTKRLSKSSDTDLHYFPRIIEREDYEDELSASSSSASYEELNDDLVIDDNDNDCSPILVDEVWCD